MDRPPSPCIKVCQLDGADYCVGCLRSRTEIAAWSAMTPAEQWQVIGAVRQRQSLRSMSPLLMSKSVNWRNLSVDVTERIKNHLSSNPVVLFMKGTPDFPQCGFSARAVQALKSCGVEFAYVNIFEDQEVYKALPKFANWPTFPQLYVKGELVGGCDITLDLYQSGQLKKMLEEAVAEKA